MRPVNSRLDSGAGRRADLGQALDVVEVDRTGEAEGAAPGDDSVGGVHGAAEVAVGVPGAHRAGEQADDPAARDASDQRHAQPGRPPLAQLRAEAEDDRGHRAKVPGALNVVGRGQHAKLHAHRPPLSESRRCPPEPSSHRPPSPVVGRAVAVARSPWPRSRFRVPPRRRRAADLGQVAAKNFAGAQVLSQVYGQALAAQGAHVTFADAVGPTEVVFPALQPGTFDAYADYQGTLLTYLGGRPTANSAKTHAALVAKLQGTGITVSEPAPAVDVNGFFVTRKTAKKYRLSKVSDLREVAPRLSIGAPPECPASALPGRRVTAHLRPEVRARSCPSTPTVPRHATRAAARRRSTSPCCSPAAA